MHIHTVELKKTIGSTIMRQFIRRQQHLFKDDALQQFLYNQHDTLKSQIYPERGIRQIFIKHSPTSSKYFFFSIIVNLQCLTANDTTIGLFHCSQSSIDDCERNFRCIMGNMFGCLSSPLQDWSVKRIDYAYDIISPHTPVYVKLFKRGRIPRRFLPEEKYDGSFYLKSKTDDVRINFYDKRDQLIKRGFSDEDRLVQEAENILRIEVQCRGSKLHNIRSYLRSIGGEDHGAKLRTYLNPRLSNWVIQDYFRRAVGYGDYYDFESARQRIINGPGRSDRHEGLIKYLRLIEQCGSVQHVKENFAADGYGCWDTYNNYLNHYLPQIGINPVIIPDAIAENLGMPTLSNPMPIELRINP